MKSNLFTALVSLMLFCTPLLASVSNTNSDDAVGEQLYIKHGDRFTYAITGTFTGKIKIERLINSGWELVVSTTSATASGGVEVLTPNRQPTFYRCRWYDYVGGASTCALTDATAGVPDEKVLKNSLGEVVGSIQEYGLDIQNLTVTSGATIAVLNATSIIGTITNDDAAEGRIGEIKSANSATDTLIGGTTGQYWDAGSLALSPGDWDVEGAILYNVNGGTVTEFDIGLSATAGNSATGLTNGRTVFWFLGTWLADASYVPMVLPRVRVSISAATTYYLKGLAAYTVAQPKYRYSMTARRVR